VFEAKVAVDLNMALKAVCPAPTPGKSYACSDSGPGSLIKDGIISAASHVALVSSQKIHEAFTGSFTHMQAVLNFLDATALEKKTATVTKLRAWRLAFMQKVEDLESWNGPNGRARGASEQSNQIRMKMVEVLHGLNDPGRNGLTDIVFAICDRPLTDRLMEWGEDLLRGEEDTKPSAEWVAKEKCFTGLTPGLKVRLLSAKKLIHTLIELPKPKWDTLDQIPLALIRLRLVGDKLQNLINYLENDITTSRNSLQVAFDSLMTKIASSLKATIVAKGLTVTYSTTLAISLKGGIQVGTVGGVSFVGSAGSGLQGSTSPENPVGTNELAPLVVGLKGTINFGSASSPDGSIAVTYLSTSSATRSKIVALLGDGVDAVVPTTGSRFIVNTVALPLGIREGLLGLPATVDSDFNVSLFAYAIAEQNLVHLAALVDKIKALMTPAPPAAPDTPAKQTAQIERGISAWEFNRWWAEFEKSYKGAASAAVKAAMFSTSNMDRARRLYAGLAGRAVPMPKPPTPKNVVLTLTLQFVSTKEAPARIFVQNASKISVTITSKTEINPGLGAGIKAEYSSNEGFEFPFTELCSVSA
jgi:hypothetical protein